MSTTKKDDSKTAEIVCTGKLQIRADLSIKRYPNPKLTEFLRQIGIANIFDYDGGRVVYIERTPEEILAGIESDIKSKLGALGGRYTPDDFINNKQAILQILNMFLRIGVPYHLRHNSSACEVSGCNFEEKVPAEKLIDFYNTHWRKAKEFTDGENNNPGDRSAVEERYGADVIVFSLVDIDFSPDVKKAMEERRKVGARKQAATDHLTLTKDYAAIVNGMDPERAQLALNAADRRLDPEVKKTVISVEGSAGIAGGLLGKLGGK